MAAHSPKEPSHSIFTIPRNSFGRTFNFVYFYFFLFTFPHLLPFSSEVLASKSSFGSSKERATTFPTGPLSPPFFFDLSSEFIWQDGCDGCGRDSIFTSQGLFFCPLSHLQSYGEQSVLRTKFYYPPRALYCDYWRITQRTLKNNEVRTHPSHPLIAPQCYIRFFYVLLCFSRNLYFKRQYGHMGPNFWLLLTLYIFAPLP